MKDFITGLQFLTRIRIYREVEWSAERFGRSVVYFPLVGAVIGALLASGCWLLATYLPLFHFTFPPHALAACLVVAHIVITGGLHCDGFMDTMDGIFSGRSRERMLEIMKDSRVGANGVTAFALLILLKWSLLLDMPVAKLPAVLFLMPVIGRLVMVIGITSFPYARPDGMGKAFAQHAGKTSLMAAGVYTAALTSLFGAATLLLCLAAVGAGVGIAVYISRQLGGLTGDTYGAITELTELVVLFLYALFFS